MSRRTRVVLGVLALLVAAPIAVRVFAPTVLAGLVRTRALPKLEARLGRALRLAKVRVGWGEVMLEGLEVDGAPSPLRIARIRVTYALAPLLGGHLVLTSATLEQPKITVVRNEAGEDNVSSIVERLRHHEPVGGGGESRVVLPTRVTVEAGSATVEDAELGSASVARIDARIDRDGACHAELTSAELHLAAGPSASAGKLAIDFALAGTHLAGLPALAVTGGTLGIWKGFTLTGVTGGITPDAADPTRADIDLRGGYGGVDRTLWDAKGTIRPTLRAAEVTLNAARFDLSQLRPILAGTPIIDPELAQVDASARVVFRGDTETPRHEGDAIDFRGRVHLSGLTVFHPMLGPEPVRHLGFDAEAQGTLMPKKRTVKLDRADVDFRGLHATLSAWAEKLGKRPAFDAWLIVDPVPCQTALAALPEELTPSLQGFKLAGSFKSELHLAVDLSDLEQGVDLGGSVGIDGCKVTQAPEAVSTDRLTGGFEQAVETWPSEWLTFTVGDGNPDWVPFDQISPYLVNSIMTTEDSTFMHHRGFIPSEFSSALKSNLEHGYFHLGASSITMQMVKNVLLSREKTLSRKLQELFLTWYVERHLSKERILEIYFNVIEFGPGIYGIGRAARHYFGKPARDLTPRESVWFSSILPNPKKRYTHYCKGAPDAKWEIYLNRILFRMHQRGRLSDDEYEHALGQRLTFDRKEALPEKECFELIKRATTPYGQPGAATGADTATRPDATLNKAAPPPDPDAPNAPSSDDEEP